MSEKQDLIKQMIEMQNAFTKYERENGVTPDEYYVPDEKHPLYNYREKYSQLAKKVIELAHAEKGSKQ